MGSPAFEEPPMSEAAVRAIRNVLRPGKSWSTTTSLGRCADIDVSAFYWLAFRLIENTPDCKNPDVELSFRAGIHHRAYRSSSAGKDYAVVRR